MSDIPDGIDESDLEPDPWQRVHYIQECLQMGYANIEADDAQFLCDFIHDLASDLASVEAEKASLRKQIAERQEADRKRDNDITVFRGW